MFLGWRYDLNTCNTEDFIKVSLEIDDGLILSENLSLQQKQGTAISVGFLHIFPTNINRNDDPILLHQSIIDTEEQLYK